jgi:hypothetical protein
MNIDISMGAVPEHMWLPPEVMDAIKLDVGIKVLGNHVLWSRFFPEVRICVDILSQTDQMIETCGIFGSGLGAT